MSAKAGRKGAVSAEIAVEWSARGISVYDPRVRSTQRFESLQAAGQAYSGRHTVIGLSRRSVFVRTVRVPNTGADEIRQILMLRAADLFPVGPSELAIDYRLTDDIDNEGRLAVVCAFPTVELRRIREEAKASGLRVVGVLPVAFGAAGLAKAVNRESTAVVSRDQEGIGIDLVINGELRQSRVVPANSAIEAEVCRTYTVAGLPCGDIVASDNVVLKDSDNTSTESPLASLLDVFPQMVNVDLVLPEELLAEREKEKAARSRTTTVLALTAVALLVMVMNNRSKAHNNYDIESRRVAGNVNKAESARKAADSEFTKEAAYKKTLDRAFQPAQPLNDVARLVANAAPPDIWLTSVNVSRGRPVTVVGTSKSSDAISAYLQKLNTDKELSQRLRDVKVIFTSKAEIEKIPVVQFSLSAFPIGNLTLEDPEGKKKPTKATTTSSTASGSTTK